MKKANYQLISKPSDISIQLSQLGDKIHSLVLCGKLIICSVRCMLGLRRTPAVHFSLLIDLVKAHTHKRPVLNMLLLGNCQKYAQQSAL